VASSTHVLIVHLEIIQIIICMIIFDVILYLYQTIDNF
jgi:hypothetical protein